MRSALYDFSYLRRKYENTRFKKDSEFKKKSNMLYHVIKWLYVRMYVKLSMVVFVVTTPLANQNRTRGDKSSSSEAICIS